MRNEIYKTGIIVELVDLLDSFKMSPTTPNLVAHWHFDEERESIAMMRSLTKEGTSTTFNFWVSALVAIGVAF